RSSCIPYFPGGSVALERQGMNAAIPQDPIGGVFDIPESDSSAADAARPTSSGLVSAPRNSRGGVEATAVVRRSGAEGLGEVLAKGRCAAEAAVSGNPGDRVIGGLEQSGCLVEAA